MQQQEVRVTDSGQAVEVSTPIVGGVSGLFRREGPAGTGLVERSRAVYTAEPDVHGIENAEASPPQVFEARAQEATVIQGPENIPGLVIAADKQGWHWPWFQYLAVGTQVPVLFGDRHKGQIVLISDRLGVADLENEVQGRFQHAAAGSRPGTRSTAREGRQTLQCA